MNKNLLRGLLLIFLVILINGCIRGYTPDIVLKKDGQPCISIPTDEDFFLRKKEFDISYLYVFQAGVGELWNKDYSDSEKPYYVKNQQCLYFNYRFQTNISYSIGFFSTEKGNDEAQKSTNKNWTRYMRIIKKPDGTLQLLLDAEARDYS
ncbi:putative T6SS immunity periplasmic lipoprotein [Snodgrassella sp. CS2]|uniref:putative T6SS immunity periplasmic lipoprotein n=1 Tax=Snodgrassella sp. CS2 TaxID=3418953 RepID=UPI003D02EA0F